jgi:phosphatidylinositol alpha-mannosyltransferase
VGHGPETAALQARRTPSVEWLGRVPDHERRARLRGAAVACFPSLDGESFGLVLLEAMAAGAPVVASDIDGYRDVARAGRDAELVPPGDAGALRGRLRALLDDSERRMQLAAAGRARAADFSMDHVAESFIEIYDRARRTGAMPEPAAGRAV